MFDPLYLLKLLKVVQEELDCERNVQVRDLLKIEIMCLRRALDNMSCCDRVELWHRYFECCRGRHKTVGLEHVKNEIELSEIVSELQSNVFEIGNC